MQSLVTRGGLHAPSLIALHRRYHHQGDQSAVTTAQIARQLDALIHCQIRKMGYAPLESALEEYADLLQDLRVHCWKLWNELSTDPECTFILCFTKRIRYFLLSRFKRLDRSRKRIAAERLILKENIGWVDEENLLSWWSLSDLEREILRGRAAGEKFEEIGRRLGLTKAQAWHRLDQARKRLESENRQAHVLAARSIPVPREEGDLYVHPSRYRVQEGRDPYHVQSADRAREPRDPSARPGAARAGSAVAGTPWRRSPRAHLAEAA